MAASVKTIVYLTLTLQYLQGIETKKPNLIENMQHASQLFRFLAVCLTELAPQQMLLLLHVVAAVAAVAALTPAAKSKLCN